MKKFCFVLVMGLKLSVNYSQVAITYFPFQSLLCLSTNTQKVFFAEYKLETNSFLSNLNMEISPKFNIKRTELLNYYMGPGLSYNPINTFADLPATNGYYIDVGTRVKPFTKQRNISFVFELSPYINRAFSGGSIRTRLGLSYNFNKKPKGSLANSESEEKMSNTYGKHL